MQVKKKLIIAGWLISLVLMAILDHPIYAADEFPQQVRIDVYNNGTLIYIGTNMGVWETSAEAESLMRSCCSSPCTVRGLVIKYNLGYGRWICRRDISENGVHWQIDRYWHYPLDGIMPQNTKGASSERGN